MHIFKTLKRPPDYAENANEYLLHRTRVYHADLHVFVHHVGRTHIQQDGPEDRNCRALSRIDGEIVYDLHFVRSRKTRKLLQPCSFTGDYAKDDNVNKKRSHGGDSHFGQLALLLLGSKDAKSRKKQNKGIVPWVSTIQQPRVTVRAPRRNPKPSAYSPQFAVAQIR